MKVIDKQELHNIFQAIPNKNELEFNKLYAKYNLLVYSIAYSILKNKEDSEDIKQKVFLKIWNMEKEKMPNDNEASWLYKVTKNEALNYLRGKRQEVNIEDIYSLTDESQELNEIIDKDNYNRIISKLNKQEQEIVSLKILTNLSFKEISQILNIPMGTVQWKYYKSMYALRIWLGNLITLLISILGLYIGKINKKEQSSLIVSDQNKVTNEIQIENSGNVKNDMSSADSTIIQNITEESTITNETTQTNIGKEIAAYNKIQIGLVSITTICFIMIVIFSIILIKHQQNRKKKVSK